MADMDSILSKNWDCEANLELKNAVIKLETTSHELRDLAYRFENYYVSVLDDLAKVLCTISKIEAQISTVCEISSRTRAGARKVDLLKKNLEQWNYMKSRYTVRSVKLEFILNSLRAGLPTYPMSLDESLGGIL